VTSVDKKSEDNSADSTSASTSINSQEGVLAEDQQQKNKSLRVFAEAKKKTGISYTPGTLF
jgi:hypothetical protein